MQEPYASILLYWYRSPTLTYISLDTEGLPRHTDTDTGAPPWYTFLWIQEPDPNILCCWCRSPTQTFTFPTDTRAIPRQKLPWIQEFYPDIRFYRCIGTLPRHPFLFIKDPLPDIYFYRYRNSTKLHFYWSRNHSWISIFYKYSTPSYTFIPTDTGALLRLLIILIQ